MHGHGYAIIIYIKLIKYKQEIKENKLSILYDYISRETFVF